jgi:hypothetical protein
VAGALGGACAMQWRRSCSWVRETAGQDGKAARGRGELSISRQAGLRNLQETAALAAAVAVVLASVSWACGS